MGQYFLSVQNLGSAGYRLINWTVQGDVSGLAFTKYRLMVMNSITWPFSSLGTVDYESGITVNTESVTSPATGVASDVYIQGTRT